MSLKGCRGDPMGSAPDGILAWLVQLIWFALFYVGNFLGRYIVGIVTLGHYPTRKPSPAQKMTMFLVGTIALVVALVAIRNLVWP
jgi:hypothetical protein